MRWLQRPRHSAVPSLLPAIDERCPSTTATASGPSFSFDSADGIRQPHEIRNRQRFAPRSRCNPDVLELSFACKRLERIAQCLPALAEGRGDDALESLLIGDQWPRFAQWPESRHRGLDLRRGTKRTRRQDQQALDRKASLKHYR